MNFPYDILTTCRKRQSDQRYYGAQNPFLERAQRLPN